MISVKVTHAGQTKRSSFNKSDLNYDTLCEWISNSFSLPVPLAQPGQVTRLAYRDPEGDLVSIGSNEELQEALRLITSGGGADPVLALHLTFPRPRERMHRMLAAMAADSQSQHPSGDTGADVHVSMPPPPPAAFCRFKPLRTAECTAFESTTTPDGSSDAKDEQSTQVENTTSATESTPECTAESAAEDTPRHPHRVLHQWCERNRARMAAYEARMLAETKAAESKAQLLAERAKIVAEKAKARAAANASCSAESGERQREGCLFGHPHHHPYAHQQHPHHRHHGHGFHPYTCDPHHHGFGFHPAGCSMPAHHAAHHAGCSMPAHHAAHPAPHYNGATMPFGDSHHAMHHHHHPAWFGWAPTYAFPPAMPHHPVNFVHALPGTANQQPQQQQITPAVPARGEHGHRSYRKGLAEFLCQKFGCRTPASADASAGWGHKDPEAAIKRALGMVILFIVLAFVSFVTSFRSLTPFFIVGSGAMALFARRRHLKAMRHRRWEQIRQGRQPRYSTDAPSLETGPALTEPLFAKTATAADAVPTSPPAHVPAFVPAPVPAPAAAAPCAPFVPLVHVPQNAEMRCRRRMMREAARKESAQAAASSVVISNPATAPGAQNTTTPSSQTATTTTPATPAESDKSATSSVRPSANQIAEAVQFRQDMAHLRELGFLDAAKNRMLLRALGSVDAVVVALTYSQQQQE